MVPQQQRDDPDNVDVHLVWQPSARASLREALGPEARITCTEDCPALGPLSDGRERSEFFRKLCTSAGYDPTGIYPDDMFAIWESTRRQLQEWPARRLVIWLSRSGADYVFLRMAVHFLKDIPLPIWLIRVPPTAKGDQNVAIHRAEVLAPLVSIAVLLEDDERNGLERQYDQLVKRHEPLRRIEVDGKVSFNQLSFYDELVLGCCAPEWLHAAYVLGTALQRADPKNPVDEFLLASRIRKFVDKGLLEVDGNYDDGVRHYRVRFKT